MIPVSVVPGFVFPAVPSAYAGIVSHLMWQMNGTERMPEAEIEKLQFVQLGALLGHAYERCPFWRRRLDDAGWNPQRPADRALLARLPQLTRADLQDNFDELQAKPPREEHGPVSITETSGSTGRSVRVAKCQLETYIFDAITMRGHLWHRRDLMKKFATIRPNMQSAKLANWGRPMAALFRTGPATVLSTETSDLEAQLAWLVEEDPEYLMVNPTRIANLALLARERNLKLKNLRRIITYASIVTPECRGIVRDTFGVDIDDGYTSRDAGHIAYQCPKHEWYHVHAEAVILELVDDDGLPVPAGTPGHVLVTVLHSFTMPLIRYRIGDMAVAGPPCDCGRTLPVINKILGREVAMVRLPNGQPHNVILNARDFSEFATIRDYRLVMYANDEVDVFLTADQPLDDSAKEGIRAMIQGKLGFPFPIHVKQVGEIDWGKSWKREPFVRVNEPRP